MSARRIFAGLAVVPLLATGVGIAHADNIQDTIEDTGSGVTLVAGSGVAGSAAIRVVGNKSGDDTDPGCNFDTVGEALTLDFVTPDGVTASPASLRIASCGEEYSVSFWASTGAVSGRVTATIALNATDGSFFNQVDIPITVVQPTPTDNNSAPSNGSLTIDDGAAWTRSATGGVTLDLSAADNVGITKYRLAETQDGLESAGDVPVTPAAPNFVANDVSFALSGGESGAKEVWARFYDAGGKYTEASDSIGWDKTAPVITDAGATTQPNAAGWYKTDVINTFTLSETGSGPDSTCATAFPSGSQTKTTTAEGPAVKVTSDGCTDLAGNTANPVSSAEFKVDKTAPTVSVTGVSSGAQYVLGEAPSAGCQTTDSVSGVKTYASASSTGGLVGAITATCSGAEDNAGNTQSPVSVSYSVVYKWNGFFQPIDNAVDQSGSTPDATAAGWNKAKAGSAIPVKFSLGGSQGLNVFAAGYPKATKVTCPGGVDADTVEQTVTATTSGLKYDALADQYNYTWKTSTAYAGTCQRLEVKLEDGTSHYAFFNLVK